MKNIVATVVIVCLLTSGASASISVALGTNQSPGNPLVLAAGGVSGTMTVNITNVSGVSSDPADNMSGWQTTLVIAPTGGTGIVGFVTPAQPSSYIFSSISSQGINSTISTTTTPNDTMLSFDFNFPFSGGVQVPASANLLDLSFSVAAGASGLFGVFASPQPGSEWTDATSPQQMARMFSNIAAGGGLVQIGEILVQGETVIPEPASVMTWTLLGCIGYIGYCTRRGKHTASRG